MSTRFMDYSREFSRVDWSQDLSTDGVYQSTVFPLNYSLRMAAGAMGSTDDMLLNSSKITSDTIPCAWTNLTRILKGDCNFCSSAYLSVANSCSIQC